MKITIDTNFLISATQWDCSVSNKLLQKLIIKDVEIFTTKEILEEFANVLERDFLYGKEEIENILEKVFQFVTLVAPDIEVDIVKDDPDDNKIISCAIESHSEYILSYDKHILNIKEYNGIKMLTPEEFFKIDI